MKSIGIICEYSPFHNGHLYHINKCKELFPEHIIILVVNGYFLERGEISILSKEEKTKLALTYGVNLVIELPFVFGTQSADTFAYNSILLLNELKVENIVFGSESNNPDKIEKIAKSQLNNTKYSKKVKEYLSLGINYPTALSKAFNSDISSPNDLLGISYIKAIMQINKKIKFTTIKRTSDYHDISSNKNIISATNIRKRLDNKENISKYIPKYPFKFEIVNTDYFNLLKYKIISSKNLSIYLTVDEGIENRLLKYINSVSSTNELIEKVKTKRYTYNKINRMFIHILIGLTKKDNKIMKLDYLKVLGFDELGKKYLNEIRSEISIPLYSNKLNSKVKDYEMKSSQIYDLITKKDTIKYEMKNKPIIK